MEEADAWLVLRGILAGLAHIHSQVGLRRAQPVPCSFVCCGKLDSICLQVAKQQVVFKVIVPSSSLLPVTVCLLDTAASGFVGNLLAFCAAVQRAHVHTASPGRLVSCTGAFARPWCKTSLSPSFCRMCCRQGAIHRDLKPANIFQCMWLSFFCVACDTISFLCHACCHQGAIHRDLIAAFFTDAVTLMCICV
jgi:serine/threonine protein kinase